MSAKTEQYARFPTKSETTPRIVVTAGPSKGRALALNRSFATVGRHPTNDLVLEDARVSGVHLELRREADRVHVRDAGSTNGTWFGAHRVREIELAAGGELIVGESTLRIETETAALAAAVSAHDSFGSLMGRSTPMRELFATLERVAPKDMTLLIQGETGTGKEEVARAIHARSARAQGPFVVVDATSLPEALAETMLFGQEKGSASPEARAGLFEQAQGGTILLDEVGELSPVLQAKFLRVLEKHEFVRVGGHQPVKVDVRILASTYRDLRHEIEAGRFREDLFYRLAQVRVVIPPLRDRPEDIPLLCQRMLTEVAPDRTLTLGASALEYLSAQRWPGNVRELRNALIRAAALVSGSMVRRADVATEGQGGHGSRRDRDAISLFGPFAPAKERAIEGFEQAYLSALMKRCAGNLSLAAREADLARHHLRDLLRKRGLYGLSWTEEPE